MRYRYAKFSRRGVSSPRIIGGKNPLSLIVLGCPFSGNSRMVEAWRESNVASLPPTRTSSQASCVSSHPCRFPVSAAARLTVPRLPKPPQNVRIQPTRPQAGSQSEALRARSRLLCRRAQRCVASPQSGLSPPPKIRGRAHPQSLVARIP